MGKPTFLCIGVQKSGTTSLINYLNYHPDIFMHESEKHFFSRDLSNGKLTKNDFQRYESYFNTKKSIIGEKTPCYNLLQYAMDRIYDYNKDMKLIILLREPISRAFSDYNMQINKRGKNLNCKTTEQIIKYFNHQKTGGINELKNNGNYSIIRGYYDEILEYIFSKFKRENIYIGISEEIKNDKIKYYNEIYEFLGTNKLNNINLNLDSHIRKYEKTIPPQLELMLYNIYKSHNQKLYKLLGRKIKIWEDYYKKYKIS